SSLCRSQYASPCARARVRRDSRKVPANVFPCLTEHAREALSVPEATDRYRDWFIAAWDTISASRPSDDDAQRALQDGAQLLEEGRGDGTVEHPVVDGQRQGHDRAVDQLPAPPDGLLHGGADGQDRSFGRVDDRGEGVDLVHAEIADAEGAALVLVGLQRAVAGTVRQVARLASDLPDALAVGVADDGHDQSGLEGDGQADVDVAAADDLVAAPGGVDFGVVAQGDRRCPDQEVGDAEADAVLGELVVELATEGQQLIDLDRRGQL